MARTMAEQGILSVPGWSAFMYQGTLSTLRADPWFLSQALLIPLLPLGLAGALKVYTAVLLAALLWSFDLLVGSFGLSKRTRTVFLVAFVTCNGPFLFRLLLGRPFPLLTVLSLLALWAVLQRRPLLLVCIAAVAVLMSHLFVFPLMIAGVAAAWTAYARGWGRGANMVIALAAGTVAGFALHPYPADFVRYIFFVFLPSPFLPRLAIGAEMRWGFMSDTMAVTVLAGLLAAVFFLLGYSGRLRPKEFLRSDLSLLLALAAVFAGAFVIWMRAVDFLWPYGLVLLARVVSLHPGILRETAEAFLLPVRRRTWAIVVISYCILIPLSQLHVLARANPGASLERYAVMRDIPAGSQVLNVDWDLFPALLAVNPHARYATGIDAATTALENPRVAGLFAQVSPALSAKQMEEVDARLWLTDVFAEYPGDYLVFRLRKSRAGFFDQLKTDSRLQHLSSSGAIVIFKILNTPAVPPQASRNDSRN